jgi:diguanylate cyclase (GGDEF)-like protein
VNYSRKLLGPTVSAAVALIVVTNYCILHIVKASGSPAEVISTIMPMALPTTVAVVLVMSILYHTLQDVLHELDQRRFELMAKAQRDALTGAASREFFQDGLCGALNRFQRTGERFAVIMLDLDHFKRVNDLHGHQTGDEILKKTAERLRSHTRSSDIVARFGGDEFIILQCNVSSVSEVRRLCTRICSELQEAYELGALELRLPTSVGAVISTKQMKCADDYVRAADMALYEAKRSGRSCFRFFSDVLDQQLRRRDRLERDLRDALETGIGISVHYQPQTCVDGKICGAEALFRWTHPQFGNISATEAIEIAEESDLIDRLSDFVFSKSADLARKYPHLSVALNLSPLQFSRSGNLAGKMRDLARKESVDPIQFEFEITERLFMEVGSGSDSQVQELRACGFRVALDDFGTGYSSLSYLRRFKVDRLKLDKSFFDEAEIQENIAVIRAAVGLAHLLGLEVIAEGIETPNQTAIALESGCDYLQGHLLGEPMDADEFDQFMRNRRLRSAA